ncbi:bifunctional proline dehydrogenase/L-glutamate gamma-semialdehyde dehydrogenase PutA [Rhodomicrobium vannielii ATCC 17100]|uniref:bifunctional proline dehydrogenase/L-glutamate gamma-semialdehyde dehydrogenase PutA n=1 Tax=Rhodomicrobium vannielii TaxID=1069 RepID=UPI00191B5717|nr:bifunctional proline dehydrogenase/L-glutamate gamma-semialdehyde dehydrogenase PutA [Rhodomicrobium vannielii]MBJ7534813.1 bifunctional proline dehydrogenase/L-glutamate gamma-semialdehyde dehydrogenase PutA [Rhodomicrobium vannielii ATCC 17100]
MNIMDRVFEAGGSAAYRAEIRKATRAPEPDILPPLVARARLDPETAGKVAALARRLVNELRAEKKGGFGVEALMKQFALSSREGVALMCLAESLLRIPDAKTRDHIIRDKLAKGDWGAHAGKSSSFFVNASAWGLLVSGRLVSAQEAEGFGTALTRAVARGGEPVIRKALDLAMRLVGRQFVTGQTIEEALDHAVPFEAQGFSYSFDMLGEAAMTDADALAYLASYEHAIRAIGGKRRGRSIYEAPGISVKLSALHPRYTYAQMYRVGAELYPRLLRLATMSAERDIGFNIDAEEADRLEPSLDLMERLAFDPALGEWHGLGFVVQAYQKRAAPVIDWIVDLAERSGRRIMVRLVKGAYWDSEIKRAQVDGLSGFPVFTRKPYTDVSYIACAKRLLAARDRVFPQFATHNAHTLAAIYHLAGPDFRVGDYEFQCLHGMGEALYSRVVGGDALDRPCRIYAPVGTHETLLAYLVRRLLENGANSSFVHQLVDESVSIDDLIADPVEDSARLGGAPHPEIAAPADLFAPRRNSRGLDFADAGERDAFARAIEASRAIAFGAAPGPASEAKDADAPRAIVNPADIADLVGHAADATAADIEAALAQATDAASRWAETPAADRASTLERAADLIEDARPHLGSLIVREAGRTMPNAVSEIREATDFCRYYAAEARRLAAAPLGPVACISPWNFPLAIFTGQIAAALAAGNTVLAKPAEQTPLVAAEAVRILHEAGIPQDALHLLPGAGDVGAALVSDARVKGVVFTGSTAVAKSIERTLAERGPVPLIAETGGQNAMIVDSSALPEQVVADVLASAFDSAGQRCSALRVLCLQDDIADDMLAMLQGAMAELRMGNPARIETDVGPVIDAEARDALAAYIENKRDRVLCQTPLREAASGTFIAPTLLRIDRIADLKREVFGPVLHVLRFRREDTSATFDAINATGYGLTLGVHSRIDETQAAIAARALAGNIYVNRNMIGAVVGSQPFGGDGLSGTGPKAGGPLYLRRLVKDAAPPRLEGPRNEKKLAAFDALATWVRAGAGGLLGTADRALLSGVLHAYRAATPFGREVALPGPVGEDNRLGFHPRGRVLGVAETVMDLLHQFGAALVTGNDFSSLDIKAAHALCDKIPGELAAHCTMARSIRGIDIAAVLAIDARAAEAARAASEREGAIVPVLAGPPYPLAMLVREKTVSTNTAAAGGNASLMALGK